MMIAIGGCTIHTNYGEWLNDMKGEDQSLFLIPIDFRFSTILCNIALHDYELVFENNYRHLDIHNHFNNRYTHGKICNRCKKIKFYDSYSVTWKTLKEVKNEE